MITLPDYIKSIIPACDCKNRLPVYQVHKNNTYHYFYQCQECGKTIPVKKNVMLKMWSEQSITEIKPIICPRIKIRKDIFQKYSDYLFSDEWQILRQAIILRDKGTCQKCGEHGTDVHHKTYQRLFNECLDDLILLCRDCHRQLHNIQEID